MATIITEIVKKDMSTEKHLGLAICTNIKQILNETEYSSRM